MKAILALLIPCLLLSCAGLKDNAVPLAELGLAAAAAKGVIKPGDAVLISEGIALIASDADKQTKIIALKDLGAQAAVEAGKLSPGDKVLIDKASAIIVPAVVPPDGKAVLPALQP